MKRISNLLLCLMLTVGATALAQDAMNKSVTGHVVSSSAYNLVIQSDANVRMDLVVNSTTQKPAILKQGDPITVTYRPLDTGGFEAIMVTEGTAKQEAPTAAGSTRTLTNVGAPGSNGQTGESRTTVIGTTGSFQAPANPAQPTRNEPMDSNDTMAKDQPMQHMTPDPNTMNHSMSDDTMNHDQMASNNRNAKAEYGNTLPRTASPEPAILLIGLFALAGAIYFNRRRITI